MTRRLLLFSFFLNVLSSLPAQDTTKAVKPAIVVWSFSRGDAEKGITHPGPDTSLTGTQRYARRTTIGNNGLPQFSLSPDSLPAPGFGYVPEAFHFRGFNLSTITYFTTRSPFTEINFAAGSKKEMQFRLLHTQNVNKNLNFAAGFQRIRSEGFYQRQSTNDNNFSLTSNYTSKKNKYQLLAFALYNSYNYAVNGGVQADSLFEDAVGTDKRLVAVNLASATRRERNKTFSATQYFHLKQWPVKDSTQKPVPKSSLIHTFSIGDASWIYDDKNASSGFYSNIFKDSVTTLDSAYSWKLENTLALRQALSKSATGSVFAASVRHEFGGVKQDIYDTTFSNFYASIHLTGVAESSGLRMSLGGQYCVSGSHSGDAEVYMSSRWEGRSSALVLHVSGRMLEPAFLYQRYSGNHFAWSYDLEKTAQQRISVDWMNKKLKLGLGAAMYNHINYVYFDTYAMPKQMPGQFQVYTAHLTKDFQWKKLCFNNKVVYQAVPDSVPLRLPELYSKHSLFLEFILFKGALGLQFGTDVFFHTAYYSPAYMPATGVFYIQNEKKTGDYPFIDVFANMKIKKVNLFLKMEHLNSGMMGNTYYQGLHLPTPDRAFKFGLRWRFFD